MPAELEAVVGTARPELARLVPSLSTTEPVDARTQTESLQARLLDAVLSVLQRLSEIAPVLFVIEDLHWADPATRETIAFLIRQLRTDRVVLVMTFRADELHRRHPLLPWLAELERSGRVERIDLDAPRSGARRATLLGGDPRGAAVSAISSTRSIGARTATRSSSRSCSGPGRTRPTARLPPTLREVLLARIVALPERAQAVIGVAAVAGRRVDHDLLARVAGDGPSTSCSTALRTAVGSQVLVDGVGRPTPATATTRSATRCSRRPPTTTSCPASGSACIAPSPRRSPSADRGAAPSPPATGRSWPTTGRPHATIGGPSRHRSGPARRPRARSPSPTRDARTSAPSSSGPSVDRPEDVAGFDRVALLDRAAVAAWLSGDARRSVVLRREAVATLGPDADPIRVGTMLEQLGRALWTNGETEAALEAHEDGRGGDAGRPADARAGARACPATARS